MKAVRAIFLFLLLAAMPLPVRAQDGAPDSDPMAARLSAEKVGGVEAGDYSAGDNRLFSLAPYGDKYLLRFANSPERYVLSVERVMLGGRILRYDTGVTAVRVSVWGGLTLYTPDAPGGLPATRVGESPLPPVQPVSHDDLAAAIGDETNHLAYTQQIRLRFAADPALLGGNDDTRGLAFEALVSAATGIEKLLAAPGARQAMAHKFDSVRIVTGDHSGIAVSGRTLLVIFSPTAGEAGRASSREIALQLGRMLTIPEAG